MVSSMARAFVTGWPIGHSRSPLVHGYWLKQFGIDGDYLRHPCKVEDFENFINTFNKNGFIGGNVTLPHKETAFSSIEKTDATATRLGAVNTVWIEDDQIVGANTDGYGFMANLDEFVPNWSDENRLERGALVLGAGGAARAIIDALMQRGFKRITIANRTLIRAVELREMFGEPCQAIAYEYIGDTEKKSSIIINTTSVGMAGTELESDTPISLKGFSSDTIVNDIVYTPLITPLLHEAKTSGMKAIDGLGMLLHQAVPGFEKWFGVRPEVTKELRAVLLADLGEVS